MEKQDNHKQYKTKQRDILLSYLERAPRVHFTAGDVYESFHSQGSSIGQSTIYRQLESELNENEYIGITLTDERITPQTAAYLRQLLESRGSLLLELRSTYSDFQNRAAAAQREAVEARPLEDLFQDLYTEQTGGRPPSDDEYAVMREAGELVRRRDADLPLDGKDVERILEFARKIGGERE